MQIAASNKERIAVASLLLALVATSGALAASARGHLFIQKQGLSIGTGYTSALRPTSSGSGDNSTSTNSTSTSGDQQDQNETQVQDQQGQNETSSGSGVENDTSGLQEDQNLTGTNDLTFSLTPVGNSTAHGNADLQFEGLDVQVEAQIEGAGSNVTYTFNLIVNGTSQTIGTMVTDSEGEGELEAGFTLPAPGTYSFGVTITQGSNPAFSGVPSSQTAVIGTSSSQEGDDNQGNQGGDSVMLSMANQESLSVLNQAKLSGQIPGVISLGGSGVSAVVSDSRFSLGVGSMSSNGLAIKVTGTNVVGSRVLMVNLAGTYDLTKNGLKVTFDGAPVAQGTFSQVMSIAPSGKPVYAALDTPNGYILLLAVPHFSTHIILISPVTLGAVQALFQVDGFAMAAGLSILGAAVLVTYSRRKVYTLGV